MKFVKILFFVLLTLPLVAQVKPNMFQEETSPNNTNFEVYSQKGGVNRRATMDNLKKYFAPQIYGTIGYVPTLTGNTMNKMQFVIDPNLDRWYIDKDGVAFPLYRTHAGGDLSGSYPNPTVYKIQGRNVASTAPSAGQVLKWNATNNRWEPGPDSTGVASMPEFYQLEILNPLPSQPIQRGSIALKKYDLNDNIEVYYSSGSDWILAGKMLNVKTLDSINILPAAIKAVHLGRNGAVNRQVMQWNGSAWVPAYVDQCLVYSAASGEPPSTLPDIYKGPFLAFNQDFGEVWHYDHTLDGWYPGLSSVTAVNDIEGDGTVGFPLHLAQNGATDGQVLKWDNDSGFWRPGTPSTGGITELTGNVTASGSGIVVATIPSNTISNAMLQDNCVTTGKMVYGSVNNAILATGAVFTTHIADAAVTAAKLNAMGATSGQVLKYNGTAWAPAADLNSGVTDLTISGTTSPLTINSSTGTDITATAGTGIGLSGTTTNFTITNTGDTNAADDITTSTSAGGSLTGTYPNPTIATSAVTSGVIADAAVTAAKLNGMGATSGQVLKYNGTAWAPAAESVTGTGVLNRVALWSGTTGLTSLADMWTNGAKQLNIGQSGFTDASLNVYGTAFFRNTVTFGNGSVTGQFTFNGNGAIFGTQSGGGVSIRANNNVTGFVSTAGNWYLGASEISASAKLQIVGTGSTSATTSLLVQNSSGTTGLRVLDNTLVAIGTVTPTARLTIDAGTASANTAPLKLTSGTLNTTPESGAIEFDGSDFYGTASARQLFLRGFKGSATLDFPSTSPGAVSVLTTTDANAVAGDVVNVGNPFAPGSGAYFFDAGCNVDGTVWIRLNNFSSGSTIDPSSTNFKYRILK